MGLNRDFCSNSSVDLLRTPSIIGSGLVLNENVLLPLIDLSFTGEYGETLDDGTNGALLPEMLISPSSNEVSASSSVAVKSPDSLRIFGLWIQENKRDLLVLLGITSCGIVVDPNDFE